MKPVYYGHLGTSKKCPDYQCVLIFQGVLCEKVHLGSQRSVWITQVSTLTGFIAQQLSMDTVRQRTYKGTSTRWTPWENKFAMGKQICHKVSFKDFLI